MDVAPAYRRWLLPAALLFGMCMPNAVAGDGVYVWTDDRGVVHFSNSQVPARHMARAELRENVIVPTPQRHSAPKWTVPLINQDQKRYVRARLEGGAASRELLMLVDTGAQMTLIDQATATMLGVEFISEAGIMGVTGVSAGWIGQLRRVEIGDKEVHDWRVMVGPQQGMLLLGMDVLERLELTIASDYLETR